jgi:lysophospholipase L1-like esterase
VVNILCFGDSVMHGAWDERGGWTDRLKQYFSQEKLQHPSGSYQLLINLGMDGDIAGDLVVRMPHEIAARRKLWSTDHDLFIVGIGGNDSRALGTRDKVVSSPQQYREQLEAIVAIIKPYSSNILFISPESVIDEVAGIDQENIYWNARLRLFVDELLDFCKTHDLAVVNVFDDSPSHLTKPLWFEDGLHPNSAGHERLYELIKPKVIEMLNS